MSESPSSVCRQRLNAAALPFEVQYLDDRAARQLLAAPALVLGVVGYGAQRPDFLPSACPFVSAPLAPVVEHTKFEIWRTDGPNVPCHYGPVVGARGDSLAFGTITLAEDENTPFEDTIELAYHHIFDYMETIGNFVPIRFWNYLTSITEDDRGQQRYMRFNTGRHRAFSARLRQPVPPAASGVGGHLGASVIYFLAAREAATPIENPRQVSAYDYPLIYGITSPSFSRASIYSGKTTEALFVSGTASIVGHETRHIGSLSKQISETLDNLRALIEVAGHMASPRADASWALKLYLRDGAYRETVDAATRAKFGEDSQRLYLRSDLCRSGLLLEIEAFRHVRSPPLQ